MLQAATTYDNRERLGWHTVDLWPGSGPWVCHHFWLHYLYSRDEVFLKDRAYPIMKEFMKLYMGLLEKDEKGIYNLPFSTSAEWKDNYLDAWGRNTSIDLALIRFLCTSLLESVSILGIQDEDREKWECILENLAPYPLDSISLFKGLAIMEGVPLHESHRHHSHLVGVYPLGVLNIEGNEEERELVKGSIMHLGLTGKGQWCGFSFPWAALIDSRAGLGNAAWYNMKEYMDCYIMENTQQINGDMKRYNLTRFDMRCITLEAGFCAAAAVMEMLMQSWGGIIRVFPAIPDVWYEAAFKDLRAEGAFIVSSRLEDKKVKYIKIKSEAGGICRVKNPFENRKFKLFSAALSNIDLDGNNLLNGNEISFKTVKGAEYYLHTADGNSDITMIDEFVPLERDEEDNNIYGLKLRAKW
jgi:alpha-L-fucosidase 2